MLLERLDGNTTLETVEVVEACEITAAFYPRLHIPALPQLRTLSSYITRWTTTSSGSTTPHRSRDVWSSRRSRSGATSSPTPAPTAR